MHISISKLMMVIFALCWMREILFQGAHTLSTAQDAVSDDPSDLTHFKYT